MAETWTILKLLQWTADYFGERGIASARLDAELLLAFSLGLTRVQLYTHFDRPLNELELKNFKVLMKRRAEREPLAYLRGVKEFYSLEFKVNPSVLIPRPETEGLVEEGIRLLQGEGKFKILDIGTGSGCIPVALAKNIPSARLVAIDASEPALKLARENAERHGVADRIQFQSGDLRSRNGGIEGVFHLIVSNPPYIPSSQLSKLAPEIFYEPKEALDGGEDGLKFYPPLFDLARAHLAPKGTLLLEMGEGQSETLRRLAEEKGFEAVEILPDLAGKPRILKAIRY